MRKYTTARYLALTALAGSLFATANAARAETTNVLDLSAGVGFSTNPNSGNSSSGSGFGRLSAYGNHSWRNERSSASIHGFVENSLYWNNHHGSQSIFTVGANGAFTASPTVSLYGNLDFFGDIAGQLSNRLISVPSGPPIVDPNNPLPPPTTVPDIFGFRGHQYRLSGQAGASIRSGELSTITLTAGAGHTWFTGNPHADYTTYHGSLGYSRQISELTSIGPTLHLVYQDFEAGDSTTIVNPALSANTRLSETITASGAVGVIVLNQDFAGHSDSSVSPSFSASICGQGTLSSICAHVAHDAQSAINDRVLNSTSRGAVTTTADVTYYRQLSASGTLQATLYATHYSSSSPLLNQDLKSTYVSAVLGYDRGIGHRLFAGITGGARKVFQTGPDPAVDFNANIYLRYRIGDLR